MDEIEVLKAELEKLKAEVEKLKKDGLKLKDKNGMVKAELCFDKEDQPSLIFYGKNGNPLHIGCNKFDQPFVNMQIVKDNGERLGVEISMDISSPYLRIFDTENSGYTELSLFEGSTFLSMGDYWEDLENEMMENEPRFSISIEKYDDGVPSINFWPQKGIGYSYHITQDKEKNLIVFEQNFKGLKNDKNFSFDTERTNTTVLSKHKENA